MKKNYWSIIAAVCFLIAGIFSFFSKSDYSLIFGIAFIVLAVAMVILLLVNKKK